MAARARTSLRAIYASSRSSSSRILGNGPHGRGELVARVVRVLSEYAHAEHTVGAVGRIGRLGIALLYILANRRR